MSLKTDSPGARVRASREAAGLSRDDLAKRLDITYQRVYDIESDRKATELGTLYDIAVAIGCRPSDIDPRLTKERPRK